MSPPPRRRASLVEYAYAAALAALAVVGGLVPSRTPPELVPWVGPFPVVRLGERPASVGTVGTVRVHEAIDIEVLAPAPAGDPFDAVASATFANEESGDTYSVQAYYAGGVEGRSAFRFRFTPTSQGEWRFETASPVPGLGGRSGTVDAEPGELAGPLLAGAGRFLATGPDGKVRPTTYNVYQWSRTLEELGALPRDESALAAALDPLLDEAAALGFDAVHVAVNHEWFSLGTLRADRHGSVHPDPRTFQVLETLIALAQRRGLFVHFWEWGDEQRRQSPVRTPADPTVAGDPGGAAGAASLRLHRYLAARLGPLPNWTLSYGFDLDEWATVAEVRAWAAALSELLPLPHLITATEEGTRTRAFDLGEEKLPLVSRDVDPTDRDQDPLELGLAELERALGSPVLFEARYLYDPQGPWDMDATRRGLWRLALAGGVGALWGVVDAPHPEPEQLRTFARFWEGRLPPDGRALRLPDGELAHVAADGRRGVVYAEDSAALPLASVPTGARTVAVDLKAPYAEIEVDPGPGSWAAPHVSDWALAFEAP